MSLTEHLLELRRRLAIALIAVAAGSMVGFAWYEHAAWGAPTLGELLTGPYCALPPTARVDLDGPGHGCRLLATGAFDQFTLRLKVAIAAGAVLSCPVWIAQLWGFVSPGLRSGERRAARWYVGTASVLFASGTVLAYLVVAQALGFLLTVGSSVQGTALDGDAYFSLMVTLMVVFGTGFLSPLTVIMMNRTGVVSYQRLAGWRRGIIFGLFAFAGIATPGGDPISMTALAATLCVLFEVALQVCRVHDRRMARRRDRDELSDDEPSPLQEVE